MKKGFLIMLGMLVAGCISLQAQEYRTDESIRSQILNNRVPGAQYAPATQAEPKKDKGFTGSSLAKQIKEGKLGMPVSAGNGSEATKSATATKANQAPLTSEQSTEQAKVAAENAKKAATEVKLPPMQEEKPAETKEN